MLVSCGVLLVRYWDSFTEKETVSDENASTCGLDDVAPMRSQGSDYSIDVPCTTSIRDFYMYMVSNFDIRELSGMLVVRLFGHMTSITSIRVSNDFCHSGANERRWAGRLSCTGCPNNFWAGDRSSFLHGVFLYIVARIERVFPN